MKIHTLIIVSSIFLCGCALTRVSNSAHEQEVKGLALIGLTYNEAIAKVNNAGFSCYTHLETQPYKSTRADGKEVKVRTCWKKSAELVCPQRRYVHFEFSPIDERVVAMWPSITEQSCF